MLKIGFCVPRLQWVELLKKLEDSLVYIVSQNSFKETRATRRYTHDVLTYRHIQRILNKHDAHSYHAVAFPALLPADDEKFFDFIQICNNHIHHTFKVSCKYSLLGLIRIHSRCRI